MNPALLGELARLDAAVRAEGLRRTLAALDAHDRPAARVFVALWREDAGVAVSRVAQRAAGFRTGEAFRCALLRAGLPGWTTVRSGAFVVRLASLLEVPACSTAVLALTVGASSAPAVQRFVRRAVGATLADWRATATGAEALDRFVADVVLAHRDRWLAFGPRPTTPTTVTVVPSVLRPQARAA